MSCTKLTSLIAATISGLIVTHTRVAMNAAAAEISPPEESRPEVAAGFPDYREMRRKEFLSQIACGPLSLITILRSLGVSLTSDDTDQIIAAAGTKGTDLSQLQKLAESYGLHALGVEVSPEKLRQIGLYAVVHLNGTSFAAVTGYSPGGVQLVYR